MHKFLLATLSIFSLFMWTACDGLKKTHVDTILHNGTFYTLNDAGITQEAMAIKEGKILAIGPEHEILNKYQSTQTIDLKKAFVYPGFMDGHCHFLGFGQSLNSVNLTGTTSWEECVAKTKDFAYHNSSNWITGRGWDQNDWDIQKMPTNEKLTALFPETPVILRRIDGHAAIANKRALELAGINLQTQVTGGEILKENGRLTGVLIDNAVEMVLAVIPKPTTQELSCALLKAQQKCFEVGLTTVADAGLSVEEIQLIQRLQKDSILKMDIYAMISNSPENVDYFVRNGAITDPKLSVRSVKVYADGALGSRGALLKDAYHDMPNHSGFFVTAPHKMDSLAAVIYNAGFQMNTHCIGDSANKAVLTIYSKYLKGTNDKRWRIEHAQIVTPEDMQLFHENTIIPSVQPTHATSDMYWAEDRLGDRVSQGYAYQELLQQNNIIALGTDFPIESIDPLKTFYAAVFRTDTAGFPTNGFNNDNALTREQALKGMTIWNALANFEEDKKGTLEIGKKANLSITNLDLMKVRQEDYRKLEVTHTYVDGEMVYSSLR